MNIGILASHNGSNLQSIIDSVSKGELNARIGVVISNNSKSGAAERARKFGIPFHHLSSMTHSDPMALDNAILESLIKSGINILFLAGYLKKLGPQTLKYFQGRILNTHPSLLPKYGGKGMYGKFVHQAVIANNEIETGVSIHLVDSEYDTGAILAQTRIPVLPEDTPETLADRLRVRENKFVIEVLAQIEKGSIKLGTVAKP